MTLLGLAVLAAAVLGTALAHPPDALADSYTWTGKGDHTSFDDARNWSPESVPDSDDDVSVRRLPGGPATLTLGADTHLGRLTQGEGSFVVGGSLTLSKGYDWSGGELDTDVTLGAQSVSRFSGADEKRLMGGAKARFANAGTLTVGGEATIRVWDVQVANTGTLALEHGAALQGLRCCLPGFPALHNSGRVAVIPGPLSVLTQTATIASIGLDNSGSADVVAGTLDLVSAPGRFGALSAFNGFGRVRLSEGQGTVDASVELGGPVAIGPSATFELGAGGHLTGRGSFVGGAMEWTGGDIEGDVTTSAATTLRIAGAPKLLSNTGRLTVKGKTTAAGGTLNVSSGALLTNTGTFVAEPGFALSAMSCCTSPAKFVNAGELTAAAGVGEVRINGVDTTSSGNLNVEGRLTTTLLGLRQTAGTTSLAAGTLATPTLTLDGGRLVGSGTVAGDLVNGALVAPGAATPSGSVGAIDVAGRFRQETAGRLQIDARGIAPGVGYDQVRATGDAVLAGKLETRRAATFTPPADARLSVLTHASHARTANFAQLVGASLPNGRRWWLSYRPAAVDLRPMTVLQGLDQTTAAGGNPADSGVARTPSRVVETTNRAVMMMSPAGGAATTRTLAAFFGAPPAGGDVFDPKIVYDHTGPNPRLYVIGLQQSGTSDANGTSRIWLAVSRSADPTTLAATGWCRYAIDGKRDRGTTRSSWADFPGLAVSRQRLVISTDQRRFAPSEAFTFAVIRVLDKAALAGCPPALPAVTSLQPASTAGNNGIRELQPVQQVTPPSSLPGSPDPVYLLNTVRGSGSTYRLWRIVQSSGAAQLSPAAGIQLSGMAYDLPPDAAQSGGVALDTSDTRILGAVGRGDALTAVHTTKCALGPPPDEACIRVARLTVNQTPGGVTAALAEQSTISGAPGDFLWAPGITETASGELAASFLRSSAGSFLSLAFAVKGVGEAAWRPPTTAGAGTCAKSDARTGDYTDIAADPIDPGGFWLAGEQTTSGGTGGCQWRSVLAHAAP
jgi:hypothetical protein